jgi:hypothetical protein
MVQCVGSCAAFAGEAAAVSAIAPATTIAAFRAQWRVVMPTSTAGARDRFAEAEGFLVGYAGWRSSVS